MRSQGNGIRKGHLEGEQIRSGHHARCATICGAESLTRFRLVSLSPTIQILPLSSFAPVSNTLDYVSPGTLPHEDRWSDAASPWVTSRDLLPSHPGESAASLIEKIVAHRQAEEEAANIREHSPVVSRASPAAAVASPPVGAPTAFDAAVEPSSRIAESRPEGPRAPDAVTSYTVVMDEHGMPVHVLPAAIGMPSSLPTQLRLRQTAAHRRDENAAPDATTR